MTDPAETGLLPEDGSDIRIVRDAVRDVWTRPSEARSYLCQVCPPVRWHFRDSAIGKAHSERGHR